MSSAPLTSNQHHELKCWPQFFERLVEGSKKFEIRRDDRHFRVGDTLTLFEWSPVTKEYTGRQVSRVVTYITNFQQQDGWVVMGIR